MKIWRTVLNIWVWPVTQENWETVKAKNIWAVDRELRIKRVTKGDLIIFYVKGTGSFKGVYRVASGWYNAKEPMWSDEVDEVKYPYQCKLESIAQGDAVFNELVPSLSFVRNKAMPAIFLQAHAVGPANHGKPIDEQDYELIMSKMKEPSEAIEGVEEEEGLEHEDIITKLQDIGTTLGFEPYIDKEHTHVAKGSDVDLVWETKIANIGLIKYVFEVQSGGSKKSLITNLIQSINSPLVKKVIAVSDKEQLDKIREQITQMRALSESSKSMFVYLDVNDVNKAYAVLPIINSFKSLLQLS